MNILNNDNQKISPPPTKPNILIPSQPSQSSRILISFPKMKPVLGKRVTFRCSISSSLAYIAKYLPKMLSTLEMINLQSKQPNFKNTKTICQALKDIKRVSSLNIEKDSSNSQNLKQLKHLFNNTHHHWKKLSLYFRNSDEEEKSLSRAATEIIARLRRCRDLSYLDVSLCCTEDLKNHTLSRLFQQLKGLQNLQTFNLNLKDCENREELLQDYEPNAKIFTFKYPRTLKCLSLELQESKLANQKMLSTFVSNVSRCDSLTHFNLHCGDDYKASEFKILLPLFERLQSLKSFTINRFFDLLLPFYECVTFVKIFPYMKHLIDLDLYVFFTLPGGASALFTKHLLKHFVFLTNLKSLKLRLFVRNYSSDVDDSSYLFLPLRALINLQTLHLSLQCDDDKELPDLQSLSQASESFPNLKDFALFFTRQKVRRPHIDALSHLLKKLTSLESLGLIFHDTDLESDSLELLSKGVAHLKLSTFFFDARLDGSSLQQNKAHVWRHHKGLALFFSTLSKLKSLHGLKLNLSVFDFLTKEWKSLADALREKEIGYLSLVLPKLASDCKFQGLRSLLSSIKEMPELITLELIFKGDKLCDEVVELIASNLAERNGSLKTLELNFSETKELTNKSLLSLQHGLRNLSSLEELTLAFGPKNVFNVETFNGFFETLGFLKNLESFNLEVPSEVVPLEFDGILKKFAGHWNLKTFKVNQTSWLKSMDQNQN